MYLRAVSHYKATNDHTVLGKVAEEFQPSSKTLELRKSWGSRAWQSKLPLTPIIHLVIGANF